MQLLAQRGQRGAALAQYEACRKILAADLGAEPSEETRQLYELLRKGERPPGAPVGSGRPRTAESAPSWPDGLRKRTPPFSSAARGLPRGWRLQSAHRGRSVVRRFRLGQVIGGLRRPAATAQGGWQLARHPSPPRRAALSRVGREPPALAGSELARPTGFSRHRSGPAHSAGELPSGTWRCRSGQAPASRPPAAGRRPTRGAVHPLSQPDDAAGVSGWTDGAAR